MAALTAALTESYMPSYRQVFGIGACKTVYNKKPTDNGGNSGPKARGNVFDAMQNVSEFAVSEVTATLAV